MFLSQVSPQFNVLPEILRESRQWVLADKRPHPTLYKEPRYVDAHGFLALASVQDPSTWHSFEEACHHAHNHDMLIGFVVKAGGGVTCIDLDYKDSVSHPNKPEVWTTAEQLNRFQQIIEHFGCYTERSRSGRGVHIWVNGEIGPGVKYDGVEVYSQERYLICTGNVILNADAEYKQDLLSILVDEMRAHRTHLAKAELVELPETEEDNTIIQRAWNAENAQKFQLLAAGHWQQFYPSQSEADFALMSMLTFYSKSNEQCRRIFRMTELGKREKATKNNRYLDECLKVIRAREESEQENLMMAGEAMRERSDAIVASLVEKAQKEKQASLSVPRTASTVQELAQIVQPPEIMDGGLDWPPGLVGRIAFFFYSTAPRPVKDIAIVSAIGFMSGICGGAWTISNTGCNLYTILLALSGVGKEGLHHGISRLCDAVRIVTPAVDDFVCLNRARSAPALRKDLEEKPWCVNVIGEIGKLLGQMGGRNNSVGDELRALWTELYMKSGPGARVAGLSYSDRTKNVGTITNVAYSLLGESTPITYYMALSDSMIEDGFASRLLAYEYNGPRVNLSHDTNKTPDTPLTSAVAEIVCAAKHAKDNNLHCTVGITQDAAEYLHAFELHSTEKINETSVEIVRQIWNRSHLKMLKVAALLAIGKNYQHPIIEMEHAQWAMNLVMANVNQVLSKIAGGEIGDSDFSRIQLIKQLMGRFFCAPIAGKYNAAKSYGVIPRAFLQEQAHNYACMTTHARGATIAFNSALRELTEDGTLIPVDKLELVKMGLFGTHYRVCNT